MDRDNLEQFHAQFSGIFAEHDGLARKEIVGGLNGRHGHAATWGLEFYEQKVKKAWHVLREFDVDKQGFDLWHELELVASAIEFLKECFSSEPGTRQPRDLEEIVAIFLFDKITEIKKWATDRPA